MVADGGGALRSSIRVTVGVRLFPARREHWRKGSAAAKARGSSDAATS